MHMLGHHDVSDDYELVTASDVLESFEKEVPIARTAEQRTSLITTGGDEVGVSGAIVAVEAVGHAPAIARGAGSGERHFYRLQQESWAFASFWEKLLVPAPGDFRYQKGKRNRLPHASWCSKRGHPSSQHQEIFVIGREAKSVAPRVVKFEAWGIPPDPWGPSAPNSRFGKFLVKPLFHPFSPYLSDSAPKIKAIIYLPNQMIPGENRMDRAAMMRRGIARPPSGVYDDPARRTPHGC